MTFQWKRIKINATSFNHSQLQVFHIFHILVHRLSKQPARGEMWCLDMPRETGSTLAFHLKRSDGFPELLWWWMHLYNAVSKKRLQLEVSGLIGYPVSLEYVFARMVVWTLYQKSFLWSGLVTTPNVIPGSICPILVSITFLPSFRAHLDLPVLNKWYLKLSTHECQ